MFRNCSPLLIFHHQVLQPLLFRFEQLWSSSVDQRAAQYVNNHHRSSSPLHLFLYFQWFRFAFLFSFYHHLSFHNKLSAVQSGYFRESDFKNSEQKATTSVRSSHPFAVVMINIPPPQGPIATIWKSRSRISAISRPKTIKQNKTIKNRFENDVRKRISWTPTTAYDSFTADANDEETNSQRFLEGGQWRLFTKNPPRIIGE